MIDDMAVYIANLGKYNEGYLVGAWFTFPIDEEDVIRKTRLLRSLCQQSAYYETACIAERIHYRKSNVKLQ